MLLSAMVVHSAPLKMFIQTSSLSDSTLMKFSPGEPVLPLGWELMDEGTAALRSPLAQRILKIDGVEGVCLEPDDLIIRRSRQNQWHMLKPSIFSSIMDHYSSGDPVLGDEISIRILELLDGRIRPAVAAYGGKVLFKTFFEGMLTLNLEGGGGKQKRDMITNILIHHIPEIKQVLWQGGSAEREIPEGILTPNQDKPKGPEAKAILSLLEEKINPAIADHGGNIRLVDVTDHIAYVSMEGGCQGCSASAITLQQGVQNAILTEVPTIQSVVDVTDHASGTNPFYG